MMNNDNKGPSNYEIKSKKSKTKAKKAKAKAKKTPGVGDTTYARNASNTDNKKDNDPNKPKERKTINVSIQKRNFNQLNSILNSWDEEGLNISSEVCKCILFKHELENNPLTQTLVSTLNLVKTSLKNKQLFDNSYDEALFTVLKNIISIKIDASELSNFIVDDFYFSNPSNDNDFKKTNDTANEKPTKDNSVTENTKQTNYAKDIEDVIATTKEEFDNTSSNDYNNPLLENTEIKKDTDNSKKLNDINDNNNDKPEANNTTRSVIRWDNIPDETIFTKNKQDNKIELLNKRLDAFSYPTD